MGVLLETPVDAVPHSSDPFLVVDSKLRVQAMSGPAERLLSVREETAVNRPIVELLWPADSEASRADRLATTLAEAAGGAGHEAHVYVRPWNTYGVRMRARIATCGPPRAALLVLERAPDVGLRAVT
jgi:PAS domain-containing protein